MIASLCWTKQAGVPGRNLPASLHSKSKRESSRMTITCPHCKLSNDLGEVRIPADGSMATCPRCRTKFEVKPERAGTRFARRAALLGILAVVLGAVALLFVHDWKLDKDYFLQPGTWQGEMTYLGKEHPFELVIEKAQDGNLAGYMDWVETSPRYRLAIRGTYIGNHLVFKDYEFLERKGTSGLNDEQDVYIAANEMTGTAKNGGATLHALKRESTPF